MWRPAEGGIEVTAFRDLPEPVWEQLAEEAGVLHAALAARDLALYRRYDHWWARPAEGRVRVLPG